MNTDEEVVFRTLGYVSHRYQTLAEEKYLVPQGMQKQCEHVVTIAFGSRCALHCKLLHRNKLSMSAKKKNTSSKTKRLLLYYLTNLIS
jgi:L-lysine 2,3-aminomutase